jgi:hypothetical protein
MTKVEAMKKLMQDNGGLASWKQLYENIDKYYHGIKSGSEWMAGLRGVLYREIKNEKNFKKVGIGIYALIDYEQGKDLQEIKKDEVRMHSYLEGVMVEMGNYERFATYCADPNAKFQKNVPISQLTTLPSFPEFTYHEIVTIAKRIDVIWFNNKGYRFPKRIIEIVDSIGTLGESLNRMYQLKEFCTDFYVIAPEKHIKKITNSLNREPYSIEKDRFIVKSYTDALEYYQKRIDLEMVKF